MKPTQQDEGSEPKTDSPYLSMRIYKNYEGTMKEKNQQRKKNGLAPIHIRSYQEWSSK